MVQSPALTGLPGIRHAFFPCYLPPPTPAWKSLAGACYPRGSGVSMHKRAARELLLAPASRRWSRSRARSICPRQHLRVLPTRTRPSLFGGD